jgi:hypothetical protein
MIRPTNNAESREAVFGRLLALLDRLDQANAWYRLGHTRPGSIMIEVVFPGWHWEVEFMNDGAVEIERYRSVAGVEEQPKLLDELFAALEGR